MTHLDAEEVKARTDLVALIGERVELRRTGVQFTGLCPFHTERTPSFVVHPENGWYCHAGCGGGDAISFLMMMDKLSFIDALAALAAFTGTSPTVHPRIHHAAPAPESPARDAAALWKKLAEDDDAGDSYLTDRGLVYRDTDVLRYSIGHSGDPWLDARAREGYRVAFSVRRPDGEVQTVSLRYALPGDPPNGKKTLVLPGCSTKGAAICSPAVAYLAVGDPEFEESRILVVEGGTSWLGAMALFERATAESGSAPTWPLAVIGVSQAAGVVEAFAATMRRRAVLVGLDADEPGRAASKDALAAALKAGAMRMPLRAEPPRHAKDWADLARMENAHG